jgi:hypothetical protein
VKAGEEIPGAGVCGCSSTAAGGPISTMTPSLINATRSATSWAKAISCVTMTIVMPSRASCSMTASTSPTSSGSSAEVTSSRSITEAHRQRAGDRDTLTLAAREVLRIGAGLVGETDFGEQLTALGLGGAAWHAFNDRRAGRDVGECRHVREQVEMLKHHAGRGAKGGEIPVARPATAAGAELHLPLADPDPPALGVFQQVDAAQQRRFAGPRRTDDGNNRAALDPQRDALQHLDPAERLPQIGNLDHRVKRASV